MGLGMLICTYLEACAKDECVPKCLSALIIVLSIVCVALVVADGIRMSVVDAVDAVEVVVVAVAAPAAPVAPAAAAAAVRMIRLDVRLLDP